jgi:peptidoglycan/LPS O-acetylase OafA/YrhL
MTKQFSIYLDLVRFFAACLVVLYHSNTRNVVETILPVSSYGHEAVIIFFVLSGFVIAYVSETKENKPKEYWASRLSRIYSLAIPAILMTPILDYIGEHLNPSFYIGETTHDLWYVRIFNSLFFLNEIWNISIMSFSNVPYWSLCYEMWYYILFGIWTFLSGTRRNVVFTLTCLMLGPKILLLAPIWVLGVILYRWKTTPMLPEWAGWVGLVVSIVLLALFEYFSLTQVITKLLASWIGPYWHRELAFSRYFLGDWLLGGIVFLNFMSVRLVAHRFTSVLTRLEPAARALSGYTFSIYIFHRPLLLFWAAVINWSPQGYSFYAAVISATALSVVILGTLTEKRRYVMREFLRDFFDRFAQHDILRHFRKHARNASD